MERRPNHRQVASYLGEVAAGLIPFGLLALAIHAYVAAEALVAAIIVAVAFTGDLLLRDADV
jgi:hypothetical protein